MASFCTFAPRPSSPRPRPARQCRELALFVRHPPPPCLAPPGAAGNWVRFAQSASWERRSPDRHSGGNWVCLYNRPAQVRSGRTQRASRQIGFVCTRPSTSFPRYPRSPKFGFVCSQRHPSSRPGTPKLGLFVQRDRVPPGTASQLALFVHGDTPARTRARQIGFVCTTEPGTAG